MKWILLGIVVAGTVFSDLLQSYEMKRAGAQSVRLRGLMRLVRMTVERRFLALSIVCMAVAFAAFMGLVRIAPLSFAVPASASSFVLETILAKVVLREHISARRAAGTMIVLCGVILVGW